MIEDLPDVPPALSLLLRESVSGESYDDFRSKLISMLPELRVQSETYLSRESARSSDTDSGYRFEVHLHGALDPFSGRGCMAPSCRISSAKRIAKSMGLISDRVWVTDFFSERFLDLKATDDEEIEEVIVDFLVLMELLPLILEGIIRFRSPMIAACSSCYEYFEQQVQTVSEFLEEHFLSQFKINVAANEQPFIDTGDCLVPPVVYQFGETVEKYPTAIEFGRDWIRREVHSILWATREASITSGAVVSNSRVGLAGLLHADGRIQDAATLKLLDDERTLTIPWVSQLSHKQIIELRQESANALPQFREMIASAMSDRGNLGDVQSNPQDVILELREQAAIVRSELEVTQKKSAKFWKTTFGVLGLGLSAYGVAADQLAAGVGGLLPIIQLLIDHKTGNEADAQKHKIRPGYVLMKAQDILSHSDSHETGA